MEPIKYNVVLIYILSGLGLLCCCIAGLGFIPAGIAFFIINKKHIEAKNNPEAYTNAKEISTARIITLVIVAINILYFIKTAYTIYNVGWDEMMRQSQEMMDQIQAQKPIE